MATICNVAYFKLMQAEVSLQSDPTFARAQTILLEANSPMAQALRTLPDFRELYRDNVAVVLARGTSGTANKASQDMVEGHGFSRGGKSN